jgi:hypothetical protein
MKDNTQIQDESISDQIDEVLGTDISYEKARQSKISKAYNHKIKGIHITKLRQVGEFLLKNFQQTLSYDDIAKAANTTKNSAKEFVGDLNFWEEFPLTMIPVPKSILGKEYIESHVKKGANYANWDLKKQHSIISAETVKAKAELLNNKASRVQGKISIRNILSQKVR